MDKSIDDRVAGNTNELANALIGDTIGYGQAELANLANNLQPLMSGSVNRILADSSQNFGNVVFERGFDPNKTIWIKAIGNQGNLDANHEGLTGFDSNEVGVMIGADTALGNSSLGLAIAYGQNDIDSEGFVNHQVQADTIMGFIYGNHQMGSTTAHAHVGAGTAAIEGERHISSSKIAKSDYDTNLIQAGFGVSHQIGTTDRYITPFAKLDFTQSRSDAYTETGADAYDLSVEKATYQTLRSTLGVRGHQAITPRLALTGTLAAGVDNGDKRSDAHAQFAGFEGQNFGVLGHDVGDAFGMAEIGISYKPTPNSTLSLNYQGQWRDNYDNQGAVLGFEMKF